MTTAFKLGGTVEQYDEAAKESIKAVVAEGAGVSTSAVELTFTAGSVLVTAEIFVASAAAAETATSDLTTGILKDSTSLETAITTQFKTDGLPTDSVTVEEITAAPASGGADSSMLALYVGVPVLLVLVGVGVGLALWKQAKSKGAKVHDGVSA